MDRESEGGLAGAQPWVEAAGHASDNAMAGYVLLSAQGGSAKVCSTWAECLVMEGANSCAEGVNSWAE
eukprot:5362813-Pyramimonas_sp.AAC.3